MMRPLAVMTLRLYPKAWRRRYAEEVRDLLDARPVRARTVADLAMGAFDAWINRRLIPGGSAMRVPTAVVLTIGSYILFNLWNPGIRHMPSLERTWSLALDNSSAATLGLAAVATFLFAVTPALAVLAFVPVLVSATTRKALREGLGVLVVTMALVIALPIWAIAYVYYGMAFSDLGFPIGPFGDAMTGGFFAPVIVALALGLRGVAARDPLLAPGVQRAGRMLGVAAALNVVAWVPILLLLVLGAPGASTRFMVAMLASVACSAAISALTIRAVTGSEPARSLVRI
ncbi:hypothetical protein [Streptosporangium lutulentum]|uniref:Uncharacterized protein n=1 Tax=Streptosporangium lutulentum TaxID=1461250 RepID=A0ABT9QIN3_9ACTN|nr:hypothetical protein [Streptosporangium lutulentum]MDP9846615.1 hypothetical protein [Streptosporangium lutulentum]